MKRCIFIGLVIQTGLLFSQTIDQYLSPAFPTGLISSPVGNKIAWVFNDQGKRNIYVASSPEFKASKITSFDQDDGMEIHSLNFTPDGNRLIYVRGNGVNHDGEAANPAFLQSPTSLTINIVDAGGAHQRLLTKGSYYKLSPDGSNIIYNQAGQIHQLSILDTNSKSEKLFSSRGGQNNYQWSPEGSRIAFVSNRGDHSFIGLYEIDTKKVKYIDASMDHDISPVWSVDGKQIAYIRLPHVANLLPFEPLKSSNPWSIRIYDIPSDTNKEIWKASAGPGSALSDELPVSESLLWWTKNNQIIFPYEKEGWIHLYSLNPMNGNTKIISQGEGEVEEIAMSHDRNAVYYVTNIEDINRRHIWKYNINDQSTICITKGDGIEWNPAEVTEGIACLHSTATRPAWPALYKDGMIRDISPELFSPDFPANLVKPSFITIKATDGKDTYADLFLPASHKPGEKHPAAIFIHGGSRRQMLLGFHYSPYYSNAYAMNQYLASKGYVVLSLNYRSGIGYGLHYREADHYGATGASEVNDLIAAGNYLRNRPDVNGKVSLWGGSYGGYMTAHGLTRTPDLFACGVDIHGVHDWTTEMPTFMPDYNPDQYPEKHALAKQSSPMYRISQWKKPVLLIHGEDDRNVPFDQSVTLLEKLRKQRVTVETLVLPDEVHGFLLHRSWLKVYKATSDFIDKYGR